MARRTLATSPGLLLDLLLVLALLLFALAVRWPNYMTVPVISDETREVLWAVRIAEGAHLPLTSVDPYDGPLFPYLIALAWRVFPHSIETPRLVVLALGALTVPLTYGLGRLWANRLGALIGATLMATSAPHIFVNSHVAWSNATTPFFTTLAILAFEYARTRESARAWMGAGFLYALALQTHPSVLMLAPALAAWLWLDPQGRARLRPRLVLPALAAALVAYSPVLVYNALYWGQTQSSVAAAMRREYAFGLPESAAEYLGRVALHGVEILRAFAASFRTRPAPADYFSDTAVVVYLALLVAALGAAARTRLYLPACAFVSTILLLAVFDRQTDFPNATRYFAFLLPLGYLSIGLAAERLFSWLAGKRAGWSNLRVRRPFNRENLRSGVLFAARAAAILLLAANLVRLALYPLYVLVGINEFFIHNGPNSLALIALAERAREGRAPLVWMDADLAGTPYWMCNGATGGEALAYLLTLSGVPVRSVQLASPENPVFYGDSPGASSPGVLAAPAWIALTPQNAARLGAYSLSPVLASPPSAIHCAPESIELDRIGRAP